MCVVDYNVYSINTCVLLFIYMVVCISFYLFMCLCVLFSFGFCGSVFRMIRMSLHRKEDLLSTDVGKSLYSGRFPHIMCGENSLERRGLLFTRCEEIVLFWQSSSTSYVEKSLQKEKDFLPPGVRESFYSGIVHPHQTWRDLFEKKRNSFHQV